MIFNIQNSALFIDYYYQMYHMQSFTKPDDITVSFIERIYDFTFLLKEFSPLLTALTAVFNLGLVIYFFVNNKGDIKHERELARKSYWYREVILNKNLTLVTEKYSEIAHLIKNFNLDDFTDINMTFMETINKVSTIKRSIIDDFNDLIKVMDLSFSEKLDIFLDDFEDSYTEMIEDLLTTPSDEWESKKEELLKAVIKNKHSFLTELYNYEKQGYLLD